MNKIAIILVLGLSSFLCFGQKGAVNLHSGWDKLLVKYANPGKGTVHYKGMKGDIRLLNEYLALLSKNPVQKSWSKSEKMAYWINAYNAYTIKMIIDKYPIAKITDLENGKPWDLRWIKLGERTYSLNEIEQILRDEFKDPRIHFAINCGAKSCPPLYNHAFTSENLEKALDSQTRTFINTKNNIKGVNLEISMIFNWYAKDFGNVRQFISKYSPVPISEKAVIKNLDYDWSLNDL